MDPVFQHLITVPVEEVMPELVGDAEALKSAAGNMRGIHDAKVALAAVSEAANSLTSAIRRRKQ